MSWSPRGEVLATAGCDRVIHLWDARTGRPTRVLRGHSNDVQGLQFSNDGRRLVSCGRDATVRVWDVASGSPLYSASADETIREWDVTMRACLRTMRPRGPYADMDITGVTGLSDGQHVSLLALGAVDTA